MGGYKLILFDGKISKVFDLDFDIYFCGCFFYFDLTQKLGKQKKIKSSIVPVI